MESKILDDITKSISTPLVTLGFIKPSISFCCPIETFHMDIKNFKIRCDNCITYKNDIDAVTREIDTIINCLFADALDGRYTKFNSLSNLLCKIPPYDNRKRVVITHGIPKEQYQNIQFVETSWKCNYDLVQTGVPMMKYLLAVVPSDKSDEYNISVELFLESKTAEGNREIKPRTYDKNIIPRHKVDSDGIMLLKNVTEENK